jgi:hypothetical protein
MITFRVQEFGTLVVGQKSQIIYILISTKLIM